MTKERFYLKHSHDAPNETCDVCACLTEIDRLEDQLRRYGAHDMDCAWPDHDCDCGFTRPADEPGVSHGR